MEEKDIDIKPIVLSSEDRKLILEELKTESDYGQCLCCFTSCTRCC